MFDRRSALTGHRSHRPPFIAALVATVLAGCMGTSGRADNPMEEATPESREIELLVRNNNFSQATIYTSPAYGGTRRLGVVGGKSEATLKFEWALSYIQLRIKFLAGSQVLTESLPVFPGELLELIIE